MLYGQDVVAVGITDGEKRVAVYISTSIDEVIKALTDTFGEAAQVADEEQVAAMQAQMQSYA